MAKEKGGWRGTELKGKRLKIATWNVRGLLEAGKIAQIVKVMRDREIDLLILTETHCKVTTLFCSEGYTFYHATDDAKKANVDPLQTFTGVTAVLAPKANRCLTRVEVVGGRIIVAELDTKKKPTTVIGVYAPPDGKEDGNKRRLLRRSRFIHRQSPGLQWSDCHGRLQRGPPKED